MLSRLSKEKRYAIADAVARHLTIRTTDRSKMFGVVLNAQIKYQGKVGSLAQLFSEEIAYHITNLVIRRKTEQQVINLD